jgi:hypothetical protein
VPDYAGGMADERDERPGDEGFTTAILREATASGMPDEPPPPGKSQSAAFPQRGEDADTEAGDEGGDRDRSAGRGG